MTSFAWVDRWAMKKAEKGAGVAKHTAMDGTGLILSDRVGEHAQCLNKLPRYVGIYSVGIDNRV